MAALSRAGRKSWEWGAQGSFRLQGWYGVRGQEGEEARREAGRR